LPKKYISPQYLGCGGNGRAGAADACIYVPACTNSHTLPFLSSSLTSCLRRAPPLFLRPQQPRQLQNGKSRWLNSMNLLNALETYGAGSFNPTPSAKISIACGRRRKWSKRANSAQIVGRADFSWPQLFKIPLRNSLTTSRNCVTGGSPPLSLTERILFRGREGGFPRVLTR
jgi:hypothetical protein